MTILRSSDAESIANWEFRIAASLCPSALFLDTNSFSISFVLGIVPHLCSRQSNSDTLQVAIYNPDLSTLPWSKNKRLQAIELLFRPFGSLAWNAAKNDDEPVTFAFAVPQVLRSASIFVHSSRVKSTPDTPNLPGKHPMIFLMVITRLLYEFSVTRLSHTRCLVCF